MTKENMDPVDLATEESFPASDPPSWTASRPSVPEKPGPLFGLASNLEHSDSPTLDAMQQTLDSVAGTLEGSPERFLRGDWLGHALHPLLTDLPLGFWLSAGILDLFGGPDARRAAKRLVGWGVLAAVPTAAAGTAEWKPLSPEMRRVGAAHALGNSVVVTLYGGSWLMRRFGRQGLGVLFALAGGMLAWVTGYLGGHMSFGRGVGTGTRGR